MISPMLSKTEKSFSFTVSYIIYGAPAEVFKALTDAEIVAEWSGDSAVLEPKINGAFELFGGWVKGVVLAFEPGKKLSYTWKPNDWDKNASPSIVTWIFEKDNAGTKITLTHENIPDQVQSENHREGWTDYVFEPLNDYFTM